MKTQNLITKGWIRQKLSQWTNTKFPSFTSSLNELFSAHVNRRQFAGAVLYSLGVELCGILHVYIAMLALNT
jgi:phosphatidylglycerol lysyltransferase